MNRRLRFLTLLVALLLCLGACPVALAQEAEQTAADLTKDCTITLPENLQEKLYRITDGLVESFQRFDHDESVTITPPAGQSAQGLYLEWYTVPKSYAVETYDAAGTLLSSIEGQPFLNSYIPLDAASAQIKLVFGSDDAELAGIRLYGEGTLPADVQLWQPTPETADLLYIASTPQSAVKDFFGVLAAYTVEHEIPSALVVLSKDTRNMQEGLLAGLWEMGFANYPQFGSLVSTNNDVYKRVCGNWGSKPTTKLVQRVLSQYGARVVMTNTPGDQAFDGAAQYCAEVVQDELQERGADDYTTVQKLYCADPSGTTALDWTAALIHFNGASVAEAANAAYAKNPGMRVFHKTLEPAATFTLGYTTVGDDTGAGDLLENIDTAALTNYVVPTPSPTPTPEPTPEPTPQPTPESSVPGNNTAAGDQTTATAAYERYMQLGVAALLFLGALIAIVVAVGKGRYLTARYSLGRAVFASFLPLVITGLLAAGFLLYVRPMIRSYLAAQTTEAPVATALPDTPVPSLEPTQASPDATEALAESTEDPTTVPTESPESSQEPSTEPAEASAEPINTSAEPTAEATKSTSDATQSAAPEAQTAAATATEGTVNDDQYYRQASDPAEVVVTDAENGHWEYKTDTLSIIIDRTIVNEPKLNRIYTAEIRMRGEDAFRTVQAAENRNGMGSIHPWVLARDGQCVLMVTGDNLIQSDTMYKGTIIRGGIVFQNRKAVGSMAMYPDLTMRLIDANSMDADELLMDGARDVFSFGPVLVSDGVVNEAAGQHRLSRRNNPRTGLGMIEPGHYIVIVVDGRQPDYSVGMLLDEFAQLFVDRGCKVAYNLDGGVSACMVFMGEQLNRHGNKRVGTYEDSYQRRIPDGLVWGYSDQVPDSDDPIYNTGTSEVPTP